MGLANRVTGRLQKWRWLLTQLSFRGRCLIVNNLAASMLWHRVTVLNPPKELLITIQKAFVDFFFGMVTIGLFLRYFTFLWQREVND